MTNTNACSIASRTWVRDQLHEVSHVRISISGLTSDSYYYIILSTLDACSWMQRVNFTGRLIYFDYQPHSCEYDSPSSSMTMDRLSPANEFEHHSSYYRSRLSFRSRHDAHSSPTSLAPNSSTVSNSANHSSNSCTRENHRNANYFSFDYLNSKLSKSSQSYARALYDSLNLLVRVMASDLIDCRAYRLKKSSKKSFPCQYANVYIFSTRKFSSNQFKKQIELIGRYSTSKNQYQSCQVDEREDAANAQKLPSSRVYYITSLFDEPFLMLRRQANAPARHDEGQVSLRSLGGHVFDFGELEGYCVDLAEKICSILNITCQFRIVQDGNFGSKNASTGVWNGKLRLPDRLGSGDGRDSSSILAQALVIPIMSCIAPPSHDRRLPQGRMYSAPGLSEVKQIRGMSIA